MIIALLLSILDIIIFVFMRKMNLTNQKETERQLLNMQLMQQQNEIQQLDQQYRKLSTLQHDFTNKIPEFIIYPYRQNESTQVKYASFEKNEAEFKCIKKDSDNGYYYRLYPIN